jgi:hypothetical protein
VRRKRVRGREAESEARAAEGGLAHLESAAQGACDHPRDRQAEPGTCLAGRIELDEPIEDPLAV